ncbi:glycosyltransferase family 9 protein [Thauera sinica]|uniref:Glycosyltransferase family 9 protein n=1 Tax=Thauera sinica TaxID=2665146 RepID=A0ABW1APM2_9RHOO|nr:glycosyltransferase family 9 protein [Thauera sp. K11]ATE62294.1 lipopolysaccharide heptosyltransferase [Thauera sp. K11]
MVRPSPRPALDRLLIVRASAIGDVVFASPFAAAVKRTYPQAHVAWLVEPGIHELLAADPCIDELILWPKAEWRGLWREKRYLEFFRRIRAFRALLRAKRFDTAIDMQSLLKSGLLAWLSGAPRRIGLGSREGSRWLMTEVVPKGGIERRISSEYLYLAERLGLDTGEFLPRLCVSGETEAKVGALLAAHGLEPGRYAVFAPFTTRPQKHWFEDAWQALAPRVRDELGLTPVILGGPADRDAAQRIAAAAPGVLSLAGATRLPEAAGLIRHAGLLVGVDTGLTHMGTAFATPTVALFGSTRPYLDTGRPNGKVIWLGLPCSPCRRRPTCNGAFTCLRDITAGRVMQEARAVLAAERAA